MDLDQIMQILQEATKHLSNYTGRDGGGGIVATPGGASGFSPNYQVSAGGFQVPRQLSFASPGGQGGVGAYGLGNQDSQGQMDAGVYGPGNPSAPAPIHLPAGMPTQGPQYQVSAGGQGGIGAYGNGTSAAPPQQFVNPLARGTNLPQSFLPDEVLPNWSGVSPTGAPGTVPLRMGEPDQGGGSIGWFDPMTGTLRGANGMTTDNRLTGAGPGAWAALAARAASNPGGMLTDADYRSALQTAYPGPALERMGQNGFIVGSTEGLNDRHLKAQYDFLVKKKNAAGVAGKPGLAEYIKRKGLPMPGSASAGTLSFAPSIGPGTDVNG